MYIYNDDDDDVYAAGWGRLAIRGADSWTPNLYAAGMG